MTPQEVRAEALTAALAILPKGVAGVGIEMVLDYATAFERYINGSGAGERETVRTVARGAARSR